jgi:hypothetical protein
MKKLFTIIFGVLLLLNLGITASAVDIRAFTTIEDGDGNGTNALDDIPYIEDCSAASTPHECCTGENTGPTCIDDGWLAMVFDSNGVLWVYEFDESATNAEDGFNYYIRPYDYTSAGVWVLQQVLNDTTSTVSSAHTIGTTGNKSDLYGAVYYVTSAATLTYATINPLVKNTFINMGGAPTIDPDSGTTVGIRMDGAAEGSAGASIVNSSAAAGDMAVCTYYDSTTFSCQTNGWE